MAGNLLGYTFLTVELGYTQDRHAGVETPRWVPVTVPWTYIALRVPSPQLWSKPGHSEVLFCPSVSQVCGCSKSAPGHIAWLVEFS